MPLEQRIKTAILDRKHDRRAELDAAWCDYDLLVAGGHRIRQNASRFLVRKPKEHGDVYNWRVRRFTYENHLANVESWYGDALFGGAPAASLKQKDAQEGDAGKLLDRLRDGVDRLHERSLWSFWRGLFCDSITYGCYCYVVEKTAQAAASKADERERPHEFDPYLVRWSPLSLRNWSLTPEGQLDTVVLANERRSSDMFAEKPTTRKTWMVYTRDEWALYVQEEPEAGKESEYATLEGGGKHVFSARGRNPVRLVWVDDLHWLADRAASAVRDHIDIDNSTSTLMHMANTPIPVILSDQARETANDAEDAGGASAWSQTGYLFIEPGGDAKYLEPSGVALDGSLRAKAEKREEIYRLCHLMAQGRSSSATPAASSGIAKQMDMAPAKDVLESFGDEIKPEARRALEALLLAGTGAEHEVEITGFTFAADPHDEISTAKGVAELGIQSDTLGRDMHKRVARAAMHDSPQDDVDAAIAEIDSAPGPVELAQKEREEERAAMARSFGGA